MLDLINGHRAYHPELVAVMMDAFERASQSLPSPADEEARRKLALEIIRRVDDGERDPMRLTELALKRVAAPNPHRPFVAAPESSF